MNPFTMRSKLNLIAATLAFITFFGCNRQTENLNDTPLSDYLPLQVGKYITYRLDSTVFTNFGSVVAVHSYQEKQIVDAEITDGLGRPSYRILRFIRDTAGSLPWAPAGSYAITPTNNTVEVIENNLRIIKLVLPIQQDNTWKANRYLPDNPFNTLFSFSIADAGIQDWEYTYTSTEGSMELNGQTYNDVLTVDGVNDVSNANADNATVVDANLLASVDQVQDVYAKSVGLVYQKFIMWEYQPTSAAQIGFGIRRSIIDHN